MRILVTGSAGHLGEALMRTLEASAHEVEGLDINKSPYTTHVGSLCDAEFVGRCAFGASLIPAPGEPAAWITEDVAPIAKNIYGATKVAAEVPGRRSRIRAPELEATYGHRPGLRQPTRERQTGLEASVWLPKQPRSPEARRVLAKPPRQRNWLQGVSRTSVRGGSVSRMME